MQEIVVLFGGGDAGGFVIINGKLHRIPPYNPETAIGRAQAVLNAANALSQAASVNRELSSELNATATKLAQEAIGQITKSAAAGHAA
ncbi:MAG TPA: hypothetical protein VFF39_00780 [Verrucomicrobiae bacterium]|nr:hypothetical protein [Verrucomicrobiae bacterium]